MALEDAQYIVYLKYGSSGLCLGIDAENVCRVVTYESQGTGATWNLMSLPGNPGLLLQHIDTGFFLTFGGDSMQVQPLVPNGVEFYIVLDDVGDGFVAINNHDGSYVVDANGDTPDVGALITPWKWNGGDNQRWRLVQL